MSTIHQTTTPNVERIETQLVTHQNGTTILHTSYFARVYTSGDDEGALVCVHTHKAICHGRPRIVELPERAERTLTEGEGDE